MAIAPILRQAKKNAKTEAQVSSFSYEGSLQGYDVAAMAIAPLLLTFCTKSLIFPPADLQNIYMREAMKGKKTDLLQGTLDMLVLKALALGPMHGLSVSNRIAQITQGVFLVKPSSLFPALHRIEEAG